MGLGLLEQKKWAEAEPLLRQSLAIRANVQPDAWTTFNTRSLLGGALLGRKGYAEAEPLLLAGYRGLEPYGGAGAVVVAGYPGMKEGEESGPAQGPTHTS